MKDPRDLMYPRLRVYKAVSDCDCPRCQIELPWRVQEVRWPGDRDGFVEFKSVSVESCWAHVAYKFNPKVDRLRLTKTLRERI